MALVLLKVGLHEPLVDIKGRVQVELQVHLWEFKTWRWVWHSRRSLLEELADTERLASCFRFSPRIGVRYANLLGIEHRAAQMWDTVDEVHRPSAQL